MPLTQVKNNYSQTATELLEDRKKLTDSFLVGAEKDYLVENARLLDHYFRESFATSVIGPRIGILKNPYAIIALGGYGRQRASFLDQSGLSGFGRNIGTTYGLVSLYRTALSPLCDLFR